MYHKQGHRCFAAQYQPSGMVLVKLGHLRAVSVYLNLKRNLSST